MKVQLINSKTGTVLREDKNRIPLLFHKDIIKLDNNKYEVTRRYIDFDEDLWKIYLRPITK